MRFAFWRRGGSKPVDKVPAAEQNAAADEAAAAKEARALDWRTIAAALGRNRLLIIAPTLLTLLIALAFVSLATPRYQSEARILIDTREGVDAVRGELPLLLSRDLAREINKANKLAERPEFDPVLNGLSPLKSLLVLFGIVRDPLALTPEDRVLAGYFERLTVRVAENSQGVVVGFQSRDPELAARVANSIAERYLVAQQAARQHRASAAAQSLSDEIDTQRQKVVEAEAKVAALQSKSLIDARKASLAPPQLGELSSEFDNARAQKSEAEAKARLIRDMLQSGRPFEASELVISEPIRRLSEQRGMLRAQLAQQSLTLLDGHPRIKELKAQLADLDRQLREEAGRLARALESEARSAASQDQPKQAPSTLADDQQLQALQRDAKAQRELLQSHLAKSRASIEAAPPDIRIISRAVASSSPAYPQKLPIVLTATLATLLLSAGAIVSRAWRRVPAPEPEQEPRESAPSTAAALPQTEPSAPVTSVPIERAPLTAALPDTHPDLAAAVSDLAALAAELREPGQGARKLTILGFRQQRSATITALTLARLLSRSAKVVLVELSAQSPALQAISTDPGAPGLAELMLGQASFGQILTRDRFSQLHLVTAGHGVADRSLLRSPRLNLALDALLRVYDYVLLDASAATDLSVELLSTQAHAIVLPDPAMTAQEQALRRAQLMAVGFADVTMLGEPPALTVPAAA
jgi:uncharacterized protein involved in exopolysaccharide biosynthesis